MSTGRHHAAPLKAALEYVQGGKRGRGAPPPPGPPPGGRGVYGKGAFGKGKAAPQPVRFDMEKLLPSLHEATYEEVTRAVAQIAHMDSGEGAWGEAEIVKRLNRYICRACADPEVLEKLGNWRKLCELVVQRSMHGYSVACGETAWFYDIDLAPAFARVCWEILETAGMHIPPQAVHEAVQLDYQDILERRMLDKAMWNTIRDTFANEGEKVQSKIFGAVSKSYWTHVDEAVVKYPRNEHEDLRVVQEFIKSWMNDSMKRAWNSLPAADAQSTDTLPSDVVSQLFEGLVVPFGEENPFTCIPGAILERIGRPPAGWDYCRTAAEEVMNQYNGEDDGGPARKKRRGGGGEDWQEQGGAAWGARQGKNRGGKGNQGKGRSAAGAVGNPSCTSSVDCVGRETDRLVQHVLHGKPADIYCETCWLSFSARNPTLEGNYLD